MNSSTRPAVAAGMVNAKNVCANPVPSRNTPNSVAATWIEACGDATTSPPTTKVRRPDTSADLHNCFDTPSSPNPGGTE